MKLTTPFVCLCLLACDAEITREPEPWAGLPASDWPDVVLTNDVQFADTVFDGLANAFLVDLGSDTVGVTAKHIFLLFAEQRGLTSIDLGPDFVQWDLRSVKPGAESMEAVTLINQDPQEPIGDFNTLKVRDWLVFDVAATASGVQPLRPSSASAEKGDTVYAVGRSLANRYSPDPTIVPLRIYQALGPYYYVQSLDPSADPVGTSGSPVIDGDGYLIGLVSGAAGRLGVVASLEYLMQVLDRYGARSPGADRQAAGITVGR